VVLWLDALQDIMFEIIPTVFEQMSVQIQISLRLVSVIIIRLKARDYLGVQKHIVNLIVSLKEYQYSTFKATLIKHQYLKTPKSAILYTKNVGKIHLMI